MDIVTRLEAARDCTHLEFVHSETGVRTLKAEFDKIDSHNEHHLEQIDSALAGS